MELFHEKKFRPAAFSALLPALEFKNFSLRASAVFEEQMFRIQVQKRWREQVTEISSSYPTIARRMVKENQNVKV